MSFLSGGCHHHEAVTMRGKYLISLLVFFSIIINPAMSTLTSEEIENSQYLYKQLTGTINQGQIPGFTHIYFKNIQSYNDITLIVLTAPKSTMGWSVGSGSFSCAIGSGHWSVFEVSSSTVCLHLQWDNFNRGALTGEQTISMTYSPALTLSGISNNFGTWPADNYNVYITSSSSTKAAAFNKVDVYYKVSDKAIVHTNETESFTSSWVQRAGINGLSYSSNATYIRGDGVTLSSSNTVTNTSPIYLLNEYTTLSITFPSGYSWSKIYYPGGDYAPAPQTATPTATPTPVPELCGYWSLAVNTSNVLMNEYVQGTLTETDTSDRYDMIDWYRVLPSGQEILALHYVYDPGLFGMGAGWFEVTPTGAAYASSAAEAMENDIQFTTAGANHLRAKIYDDKSILPMVYHDYDLGCTLDQVVYVGETTQASNTLGINVKECDTSAMLTGVNIGVYDYLTGQWSNKTSEYGGTTYFNVVPGHNVRVVANKTGWLNSDTDYTIPATPYLYEVCLKRPLVDIEDKSYVFFNVRDSVTLTGLFQANIQLSDGQIQNTLPSGYAGFSVNDSETYIYTVTKPGYQSFSDSFTITTDTTIPVKLVQISPTPTLTYPITTLPTVTITGTGTVTPTGTGTGVWSNTTATLSPTDKTYKTTKGLDIWYMNLETLSGLLFVAAVFGAIGLISDSMGRRRRR